MNTLEQATIVARAIHTLEVLRNSGIIKDAESMPALFAEQSWNDLRRLKQDDGSSKLVRKSTKKHKDITYTVPALLCDILRAHRAHQDEERTASGWREHGLVFTSERGTPLEAQNFTARVFKPALERAGLSRRVRVHDMRHAAATLLLSLGVDLKTVSGILGHSSAAFTAGTYIRALPALSAPALEQLGQLLRSDAQTLEIPRKVPAQE